jgi:hypothetical protein
MIEWQGFVWHSVCGFQWNNDLVGIGQEKSKLLSYVVGCIFLRFRSCCCYSY